MLVESSNLPRLPKLGSDLGDISTAVGAQISAEYAIAIISNLTEIDENRKFDAVFDKYYSFIYDEYMVTVANVVGHSGKIALVKPHLIEKITNELLKVENISTTPHLTEECKKVIAEKAIKSFNLFFDKIKQKEKVTSFVRSHLNSPRKTLRRAEENFLNKWN